MTWLERSLACRKAPSRCQAARGDRLSFLLLPWWGVVSLHVSCDLRTPPPRPLQLLLLSAGQLRDKCSLAVERSLESSFCAVLCICEKGPGFICAEAPCGRLTRTISAFRHETPSAIFNHSVPPWDHASLGSFAPCRVHGLRPSSSGGDSVFLCAFLLLWSRCGLVAWSGAVGKAPGLHGGSLSPQRKAWLYTLAARHL